MAVCQQLKFAVFHDYCDITERRIYWSLKNCCSSSRHEARAATKVGPEGLRPPPKICWRCPCTRLMTNVTEFKKHVHSLLHFFLNRLWIVSHFIKTVLMIFFKHHWVSYWAILRQLFRWRQIWSFRLQQRPWWWLKHKYSSFEMNSPKPRSGIMEATESEDNKWN